MDKKELGENKTHRKIMMRHDGYRNVNILHVAEHKKKRKSAI